MGFFRWSVVDGADGVALSASEALSRIHAGDLDGIIVKSVYNTIECKRICEDLETNQHNLIRTDFPAIFRAYFLGVNLNLAYPDLDPYFEHAVRFRDGLSRLFPGELGLERRVCRFLSEMDRGRSYCAAPGPASGQSYMFTTLRAHLPGGYIPEHFDDEQAVRPSYRHLMSLIRTKLTSFVLAFSQAEAGGALEVFNVQSSADGHQIFPGGRSAPMRSLDNVEKISFRLDPGDMIVFRSGNFLHRLTPVIGAKTRWTACSFMANAKTADRVYCWG
jgi:hypothetical protein